MPPSSGAGHAEPAFGTHMFVFRSQHWTPPETAGQELSHSESELQGDTHFGSDVAVGAGVDDAGGTVVVGALPASASVAGGGSASSAQATRPNRIAVTAKADFDKVSFTRRTLLQSFGKPSSGSSF